jgi:XTP/dITP diphosphohydrolase/tetrapyrrole methylase family protein/MazG family protein
MHAQLAAEAGKFTFDDVAREVNEKMVRRHPHVFGDGAKLGTSDAVVTQWEQIKLKEKGAKKPTVFKELPPSLNAILTAREVWKQVRKKQLDSGATVDVAQVDALAQGLTEEAAGRKIFELIAACRDAGIDPDSALRRQTSKVVTEAELRAPQG